MMEKSHSIVPVNVPCAPMHAGKMSPIGIFHPKTNKLQVSKD